MKSCLKITTRLTEVATIWKDNASLYSCQNTLDRDNTRKSSGPLGQNNFTGDKCRCSAHLHLATYTVPSGIFSSLDQNI